jgi:hypothetical protein
LAFATTLKLVRAIAAKILYHHRRTWHWQKCDRCLARKYRFGTGPKQKMKLWVDKAEDSGYDDALLKEEDLSTLT